MKSILLLTTGGTIASRPTANGLAPKLAPDDLLRRLPHLQEICRLHTSQLFSLDSSNIQPCHWQQMARRIYKEAAQVDGIVLCHGTDTLAYTAAALFSMLPGLDRPVILTGSQLPLEAAHTDAVRNLEDACLVCASGKFPGVYVVFDGEIISGFSASKVHTMGFHGFSSINVPPAGTIKNGVIQKNKAFSYPVSASRGGMQLKDSLNPNVIFLKLVPGMDGRILDVLREQGYEGILLEAFGAGGIPCLDDSFLDGIARCTSCHIPVVITSQCARGPANLGIYQVGVKAAAAGAVCGQGLSKEMLAVRLMWALGQTRDPDQIRRLLVTF